LFVYTPAMFGSPQDVFPGVYVFAVFGAAV